MPVVILSSVTFKPTFRNENPNVGLDLEYIAQFLYYIREKSVTFYTHLKECSTESI